MRKLNVPAALFIGLVISFVGVFTLAGAEVVGRQDDHSVDVIRWFAFEYGTTLASAVLVAIALFAVADRLTGVARVMVQIAAWARAGVAAWYVVQPLIAGIWHDDDIYEKTEYVYRVFGFAALGGLICLSIAARVWTKPSGITALAVLALVAELCGTWTPYLGPWIRDQVWSSGSIAVTYWTFREAALIVGTIAVVHGALAGAPPPLAEPRQAVFGFRLAGRALLARVLAAIALALLGAGMLTSPGGVKMMLFIAPVVVIVSTLAFAIGLLLVDRANLAGMPRVRLLLGVATVVWGVGVDVWKIGDMFQTDRELTGPWTIAAPLIVLVGTGMIVSAIHAFAVHRCNPHLRSTVASRATLFFTLMGVSALMPLMIGALISSPSSLVVLVVLAAACGIIAIVSLAGMMSLVADALSDAPQLPEARLRS